MAEKQDGQENLFNIKEISVSYVIVVAGGQYNVQIDIKKLTEVFGRFGSGTFAQVPNGYKVENGTSNQLLVQVPRILFRAASEDQLVELYNNATKIMMGPFIGKTAVAFGINFDFIVYVESMDRKTALQRLGSSSLKDGLQVTSMGISRPVPINKKNFNCTISRSPDDDDEMLFRVNNHIDQPQAPCYKPDQLKIEIANGRADFKTFLEELEPCVRQMI